MILRRLFWLWLAMASVVFAEPTAEQKALASIEQEFRTTFSNMPVVSFDVGPIKGFYELNINGNIIYYHAESKLLFFGEIYDQYGKSLTADKKALVITKRLQSLPIDKALVIGPSDGVPIIEFTDPDCPYCRAYNEYVTQLSGVKVKRQIFFYTRIHPDAAKKVEHIFCSADREQAFSDVFSGKQTDLKQCPEGKDMVALHDKASRDVGLTGTPSFSLDGALVTGFKRKVLDEYIAQRARQSKR